jgi:hypothetical protein
LAGEAGLPLLLVADLLAKQVSKLPKGIAELSEATNPSCVGLGAATNFFRVNPQWLITPDNLLNYPRNISPQQLGPFTVGLIDGDGSLQVNH